MPGARPLRDDIAPSLFLPSRLRISKSLLRVIAFVAIACRTVKAMDETLSQTHKRQASLSAESAASAAKRRPNLPATSSAPLSIREQAEPYRLVTAIFPIHVLTPEWKQGRNRPPNIPHIKQLCKSFETGLQRTDLSNTLRLACSQQEVDRMIAERKRQGDTRADWKRYTPDAWPSFLDWQRVNSEPVELMAGHHRVEALKKYLKDRKDAAGEGWWLCDVYNQDTLPLELSIRLRANREDLSLPDTHGQIWTELCVLAQQDAHWYLSTEAAGPSGPRKGASKGTAKGMEAQLTLKLGLTGKTTFPVRRLGTLWRNEPWRHMITEWCQFPLGLATFNITTWEWMSSCRVDDVRFLFRCHFSDEDVNFLTRLQFWFSPFREALRTLRVLREKHQVEVQSSDWAILSQLPPVRQCQDVQNVFFPRLQDEEGDVSELRVKGFFTDLNDIDYDRAYDVVLSDFTLQFPDVHALLKMTPRQGKIMRTIMGHVGQWLNRDAFRASNRADEKPPLWKDLLPAVQKRHPDNTADQCIELQRQVLAFTRKHFAEFSHATIEPLLEIYPDNAAEAYAERFEHTVWQDLLKLVYGFCGACFQHEALTRFNDQEPSSLNAQATSTIAQSMCQVLESIPEIVQNPALRGQQAMKDLQLAIQPVVLQWAVQQCQRIVEGGEDSRGDQASIIAKEQLDRYQRLLDASESSSRGGTASKGAATAVAASVESEPADERSNQPSARAAHPASDCNRSPSPAISGMERIIPQLVPRSQVRASKAGHSRHMIESSKDSLASSRPPGMRQSSQLASRTVHRDLDDILRLPPQPVRIKLSRSGRGWRSRPGVQASNSLST